MCPEAAARTASPATTNTLPAAIHDHAGRANHKYAAANANPRGTRARVAIRDQLSTGASQEMAGRADHFLGTDLQQSRVRLAMMRKRGLTFGMPQSDRVAPEGTGADGIGWPVQADCWNALRAGQVQRAGVAADEYPRAAGECNQLTDAALDYEGMPRTRIDHGLRQTFFPG